MSNKTLIEGLCVNHRDFVLFDAIGQLVHILNFMPELVLEYEEPLLFNEFLCLLQMWFLILRHFQLSPRKVSLFQRNRTLIFSNRVIQL